MVSVSKFNYGRKLAKGNPIEAKKFKTFQSAFENIIKDELQHDQPAAGAQTGAQPASGTSKRPIKTGL
jgi:hypothetical protein